MNEQLVKGRDDVYSGFRFAEAEKRLPGYAVKHYVDTLASDSAALRGSSRPTALDAAIAQNKRRGSPRESWRL